MITTKVAMLSPSDDDWADIDYFFAQVSVEDQLVDYKPTCGNILSAVGPAAIEMGLIKTSGTETEVKIRAVNTGARVVASVQTPEGVSYDGDFEIGSVPGTAAPVGLQFMDTTAAELDENTAFFAKMESVRLKAGHAMGMGDVSKSVAPKFGLLAKARDGGTIAARYFMPWNTHPSMAVTGAQCLASCLLTPGTVGDGLAIRRQTTPAKVVLEHPSGVIDVIVDYDMEGDEISLNSAGLIRTARKIAAGDVFIPRTIWGGH